MAYLTPTRSDNYPARVYAGIDTGRLKDKAHLHDYIQIWYTRRSSYLCDADGKKFRPAQGGLLIIPPSIPHALDTRASQDIELLVCEFKPEILAGCSCQRAREMYLSPLMHPSSARLCPLNEQDSLRADRILSDIHREYACNDRSSSCYVRARIIELVSLILAEYAKAGSVPNTHYGDYRAPFLDALTYINCTYTQPVHLADIAKIAYMSERSYTRFFQEILGMSPVEYITLLRIRRAKVLLRGTDRILLDIAESCGFSNSAHLHRTFKQQTGLSPGEYRKLTKPTAAQNGR